MALAVQNNSGPVFAALSGRVQECAQSCMVSYINQTWVPSPCSSSSGLACLCDNYSSTGYALGEIAQLCVARDCPDATSSDSAQAGSICSTESGHVLATHTVLVVGILSLQTTTTGSPSTLLVTPTHTSATAFTSTPAKASPTTLSTIFATSTSSVNGSSIPSHPVSSSGQALPVALGVVGGVVFAIALLFCCFCWRRKKKQKKEKKQQEETAYEIKCAGLPDQPRKMVDHPRARANDVKPSPLAKDIPRPSLPSKVFLHPHRAWPGGTGSRAHTIRPQPLAQRHAPHRFSTATEHTVFEEDEHDSEPQLTQARGRAQPERHKGIARLSQAAEVIGERFQTARQISVRRFKNQVLHVNIDGDIRQPREDITPVKTPATTGSLAAFIETNYCREDNRSAQGSGPLDKDKTPLVASHRTRSIDSRSSCTEFEGVNEPLTPQSREAFPLPGRQKERQEYWTRLDRPGITIHHTGSPPPLGSTGAIPKAKLYSPSVYTCDENGNHLTNWI